MRQKVNLLKWTAVWKVKSAKIRFHLSHVRIEENLQFQIKMQKDCDLHNYHIEMKMEFHLNFEEWINGKLNNFHQFCNSHMHPE